MNDFKAVKASDLKVGQDVVRVSSRYSGWNDNTTFTADKVARVTQTTVVLESGTVFNIYQPGGWTPYNMTGMVKKGERKTKANQWPDEYATLVLADDPAIAARKASQAAERERNSRRAAAISAMKSATGNLHRKTAEEAIEALQAWLKVVD